MPIHILIRRLRGQGDGRSIIFNRPEEWVMERVVEPWDRGEDLVINGEHWNPRDIQITLRETEEDVSGVDSLTTWRKLGSSATNRTDDLLARPAGSSASVDALEFAEDRRKVMVVLGRDSKLGSSLFTFLRTIDLQPMEWTQLVGSANSGAPYIGQVLDAAFSQCQAVVVLMTPDDVVCVRSDLIPAGDPENEGVPQGQARPNVFYEAGMAMGRFPNRTIFVEVGSMRRATDLSGIHSVRMDEGPECRRDLAKRLEDAGCEVNTDGTDWLSAGAFDPPHPPSSGIHLDIDPEKASLVARIDALADDLSGEEYALQSHVQIFNGLLDEAGLNDLPRAHIGLNLRRSGMRTGEMRMLLRQAKHVLQS